MKNKILLFFVFCGVLSIVILFLLSKWVFPLTTDSIIYITTAESIKAFKGLVFANFFLVPLRYDFLPTLLEPPGYPLLISLASIFGLNEQLGAVLIPRACFLLFPAMFFVIFRKMMSEKESLIAAFVCTFMFSLVKCSLMAWTDVPYLFFALLTIIMTFRMIKHNGNVSIIFVFLTGIVAGYAILIRYIGLTVVASTAFALFYCVILRSITFKKYIQIMFFFMLGVCLIVIPYLVRNQVVFGTIQPYQVGPSQISLTTNLDHFFKGMAELVFFTPTFDKVVMGLMVFAGILLVVRTRSWIGSDQKQFIYMITLASYFIFSSIFLIAYKTVYYGSEDIGERYLIQVAWIFMAGLVFGISRGLKKLNTKTKVDIQSVAALLLLVFVVLQVFPAVEFYFFNKRVKEAAQKIDRYKTLLESVPKNYILVSNAADLVHYSAKRNVRMLSNYLPEDLLKMFSGHNDVAIFLVKNADVASPSWGYMPHWNFLFSYRRVYSDVNVDLLMPK